MKMIQYIEGKSHLCLFFWEKLYHSNIEEVGLVILKS